MAKRRNNDEIPYEIKNIINKIDKCEMLSKLDFDDLIDVGGFAYTIAGYAVDNGMKNNQLRSFFDSIKKMERNNEWKDIKPEFILLKPRIAIRVGRNHIKKGFFEVISSAMNKVEIGDEKDIMKNFDVFVKFFEAIIAYHKYLGGNNV